MQTTRGKSFLIVGPPGCGKSRWIRQAAAAAGHTLFRWNCRDDRALRQGRELLHGIVRTREPTWVWLEGADDITLDAQAFLRRILETASAQVTCALEVRRLECMAEPIQSRCILKRLAHVVEPSWRQRHNKTQWGQPDDYKAPLVETPTDLDELREARLQGADPYKVMTQIIKGHPLEREVLKRSTMGMSPWILSAWILSQSQMQATSDG
uniref:ATPase AAA-type core domain-containing protein n=1 Tax=viral metagenome TaxID=1070528 RepID=A0A6C0DK87_9ZZZZ